MSQIVISLGNGVRILMLTSVFPPHVGGVESHVYELTCALVQAGHDVEVVSGSLDDADKPFGFPVHRPKFIRAQWFYDWFLHRWLKKKLQNQRFDLVHVHGLKPAYAVKDLGIPAIFTNHTSGFLKRLDKGERKKKSTLKRIAHFTHVIAPSEERCEAVNKVGFEGPVTYVPNGVDIQRFSAGASSFRATHQIADDSVVVLLVSRLHPVKGVCDFARW